MSGSSSIKVLFLVSSAYGHMDFGGLGFLRLSQKLEVEGHSCIWITCGDQVARLRGHGCQVEEESLLNQLSLMQMRQIEDLEKNPALHDGRIDGLRRVRQLTLSLSTACSSAPDLPPPSLICLMRRWGRPVGTGVFSCLPPKGASTFILVPSRSKSIAISASG